MTNKVYEIKNCYPVQTIQTAKGPLSRKLVEFSDGGDIYLVSLFGKNAEMPLSYGELVVARLWLKTKPGKEPGTVYQDVTASYFRKLNS